MRINLNLDYVLRRTCNHGRPWLAWQPDTGFTMMGADPTTTLWRIRNVVRGWAGDCIERGKHPRREFAVNQVEDPESIAYKEFVNRFHDDGDYDDIWSRCYGQSYIPEYVDTLFVHCQMELETFGRHCLIHDNWYGEFQYKNNGQVNVTALVEMVFRVDRDEVDPEMAIRRNCGHTVNRIISIEPRVPREPGDPR